MMSLDTIEFDEKCLPSFIPEEISLLPEEQQAFDKALDYLNDRTTFLALYPSVVSMQELNNVNYNDHTKKNPTTAITNDFSGGNVASNVELKLNLKNTRFSLFGDSSDDINPMADSIAFPSLATPKRGHLVLRRALEKLDGLEKEESVLLQTTPLTRQLTEIVTGEVYTDSNDAVNRLGVLGRAVPRRVCQHPFKRNDIVWVCRTCQADETCVLCHACYSQSNHEGHDVAFYHAQAGGCCDCGDPDGKF